MRITNGGERVTVFELVCGWCWFPWRVERERYPREPLPPPELLELPCPMCGHKGLERVSVVEERRARRESNP